MSELERLLLKSAYPGSIGVVSPFRAQANRIRDLVHQNEALSAASTRAELLVDTVHKFQGDERDLMIFSPVVAQGMSAGSIGFLRKQGNLFNVAITRARSCLLTVGDATACGSCVVEYLREYASYVHSANELRPGDTRANVDLGPTYPTVADPTKVSDWERLLYRLLYQEGIRTLPQFSVEQYCLDLAIFEGDRRLDIEVDGEQYHRAWNRELSYRDQLRNQRLIELGWDVVRFWVYQVRDEPHACVARVREWLQKPLSKQGEPSRTSVASSKAAR